MGVLRRIKRVFDDQRGHLFVWAPVCLGTGIGVYFSLPSEPEPVAYAGLILVVAAAAAAAWWRPGALGVPGWALALVAVGVCIAGYRGHSVAAPVLNWRYYGPVEGQVVALDRSASDALRVTLSSVRLSRFSAMETPGRVRISLHGSASGLHPRPGSRIMTTAHLAPPQGPVEPGGFDFRRHAWFLGLGAVGYTRNPVMTVAPPGASGPQAWVFSWRMAVSARVTAFLEGDVGGFAAAITTGDRSKTSLEALDALRASNLAHLLAISGLHMGLLAGAAFGAVRLGLAAIPPLALRFPIRKISAAVALMAAACYLLLSGGSVATERAFIMVAVMLTAVILDRRAISMRAVAVAALVVLALRPESLLGPGFQMSFAATTSLVFVFGWLRDRRFRRVEAGGEGWRPGPVTGVILSSAIAGAATAPFGAAHFNTLSHYGLAANLVSVPLMGVLVIPAAMLAAVLSPIGLDGLGLYAMGVGLRWILFVAHWISALPGARGYVSAPGATVLPMISLGMLWLFLWRGKARWVGLVPVVAAFWLWGQTERPQVLIAEGGGMVGVMTSDGRALSKPRGAGFVARVWLENDGDGAGQIQAAARWPGKEGGVRAMTSGGLEIVHLTGKRAAAEFSGCRAGQVVVSAVPVADFRSCKVLDPKYLRRTGSLSITDGRVTSAAGKTGTRLWTPRAKDQ